MLRVGVQEGAAVAVQFPVSFERGLEAGLAVGGHKTSMLHDREARGRLEVDCPTGALVELVDQLGVPVPTTRALHACVTLVDQLQQTLRIPQEEVRCER